MEVVAGGAERSHGEGGETGQGLAGDGEQGFLAAGNAMGCAPR